ncbi:hypothetical protein SAMN05428948_1298 [Massilia sp. CF038]|nr:hypothetical protein SAMN05428948_1298 [Massilia sp. CF038]
MGPRLREDDVVRSPSWIELQCSLEHYLGHFAMDRRISSATSSSRRRGPNPRKQYLSASVPWVPACARTMLLGLLAGSSSSAAWKTTSVTLQWTAESVQLHRPRAGGDPYHASSTSAQACHGSPPPRGRCFVRSPSWIELQASLEDHLDHFAMDRRISSAYIVLAQAGTHTMQAVPQREHAMGPRLREDDVVRSPSWIELKASLEDHLDHFAMDRRISSATSSSRRRGPIPRKQYLTASIPWVPACARTMFC